MKIVHSLLEMQHEAMTWRHEGFKIALVPTMGCLHAGHISLMHKAAEAADRVIVSLFVNPMQFGPNEDFGMYPRQFQTDCNLAEKAGVHIIFCPEAKDMYPEGFQTTVKAGALAQGMCGADRPGHFDGVATVVCKLLQLTSPNIAVFGEKDYQQLAVIRQMVGDLNIPVVIIGAPIVRESDGLAMSSRNKYLKGEMRRQALCLYQSLQAAQKIVVDAKQGVAAEIIIQSTKKIVDEAGGKLEYATVINGNTLQMEKIVGNDSVLAIAVKIGGIVRLIDNAKLFPPRTDG
jgi:pantoate--beta-alanine ligase